MPADAALAPVQGSSSLVSWSIIEEAFDEAEFLWQRREAMLAAHDQTLGDVETWTEDRLIGALEGLVVGGEAGIDRVLGPGLASDEPSRVSVSCYALLAGSSSKGRGIFKGALLEAEGARLEALRRGLELVPAAIDALATGVDTTPPRIHAAYLEACAFQLRASGPAVGDLLGARDVEVQRAAARLLRFRDHATWQACFPTVCGLSDPEARDLAVESLLIGGVPQAKVMCREIAAADIGGSTRMLLLLAMAGTPEDHKLVVRALGSEARQKDAIWAIGFGGQRDGADACIDMLAQGRQDKLAAEAFCAITGLDLEAAGLAVPPAPEADEPIPFEEEDLDADLVPRPEDRLPMPDIPGVIKWWSQQRGRFADKTRYLRGRPSTLELVHNELASGPMRRRHPLALELAVCTQGRLQIETRAFVPEQRRQLAGFATLPQARGR